MRNEGGEEYFNVLFNSLESRRHKHIEVYGSDNELRLTGKYETQSIDKFSWGVSDRGASIRVPMSTAKEWKGYVEDRRPASNANPYEIIKVISDTIDMANELKETTHKMYTNVDMKNFDEVAKKYNGILSSDELLREYQNDEHYELTSEMMESRANGKSEEIKFNINSK
jgi:glutamine synthetase